MNDIFNDDGHISDFGFYRLQKNELNEIQSLEIAEHLSFCDKCIEKYTSILSDSNLLEPPETFTISTLKKIKKKITQFICNKYFSVAIAAGFAIFLWISGVFNINVGELNKKIEIPFESNKISVMDSFSAKFNSVMDNFASIYEVKENGGNYEKK